MPRPSANCDPARPGPRRLFFALWPAPALRVAVDAVAARLAAGLGREGRRLRPERYHLTLAFLGEIGPADYGPIVARAVEAAAAVRVPPFEVSLDRAGGFAEARVWWLGPLDAPAGLRQLWAALDTALRQRGLPVQAPPGGFSPHLTIVRNVRAPPPPLAVGPLCWPVREFVLVDSQPPRPYSVVGRWPLLPATGAGGAP